MNARIGDLAGRGPLGQKGERLHEAKRPDGKDPAYLAAIHKLSCCICSAWGIAQQTPTQAHHTICGRYGQRKTPDRQAIPLCRAHHITGEGGLIAIHQSKSAWVSEYGNDVDYIAITQDLVDRT